MSSSATDVRNVPPWLAGAIAMAANPLGGVLLTAVPYWLGAPPWVLVPLFVVGTVLGYLAGRAVLRWLYTPR